MIHYYYYPLDYQNSFDYFTGYNILHGESNREFRDIFVDKYNNDWLSFLVQSLLYEEKRDNESGGICKA